MPTLLGIRRTSRRKLPGDQQRDRRRRGSIVRSNRTEVRPLELVDISRCVLLGEPDRQNRVHTLSGLDRGTTSRLHVVSALRAGVPVRRLSFVLAVRTGRRVVALASARQRAGRQSWELAYLLVAPGAEDHLPALLEAVSQMVASHGGEKVFARLLRNDPLVDAARHGGFFPRVPETLYVKANNQPDDAPQRRQGEQPVLHRKSRVNDHELFRLYNAATPSEVRYAVGMTFDQWRASQERFGGTLREFVLPEEERVRAWLGVATRSGYGVLSAVAHPDHEHHLPDVVGFGLSNLTSTGTIYCLVPEYQVALQRVLTDNGFLPVSDYVTLVKTMTASAREGRRVRVAAPIV